MSIDKLIKEAELAAERQRQAWKDTRETQVKVAKATIIQAMGENWTTFEPYISSEGVSLSDSYKPDATVDGVWYEVGADAESLAPFRIIWERHGYGENVRFSTSDRSFKMEELPDLLLNRRQEFKQSKAEAREQDIKGIRKLLDGYIYERATLEDKAQKAFQRLLELAPERKDDWLGLLRGWEQWLGERIAEAAERERLESLASEYQAFYRFYLLSHAEAARVNAARLREKQKQLDVEYTVWELEYAVITDEGGERIVETCTAIALAETVAESGYWLIWEEGRVRNALYYHLVSKKPRLVKPTMPGFGKAIETPCGYLSVWPLFDERPGAVSWKLEAVPLPAPPKPPEGLCPYAIEQAQDGARQNIPPDEDLEFIPF